MKNLREQVKKAFFYPKWFWPITVVINCSSDLKHFANSRPSASNFKSFSWSLEQFFLTVGQNNFGNKIPLFFPSCAAFCCCLSADSITWNSIGNTQPSTLPSWSYRAEVMRHTQIKSLSETNNFFAKNIGKYKRLSITALLSSRNSLPNILINLFVHCESQI